MSSRRQELHRLQAALETRRETLLAAGNDGRYVLVGGDEEPAVFDDQSEAYGEGLRRFGLGGVFLLTSLSVRRGPSSSTTWEVGLLHAEVQEQAPPEKKRERRRRERALPR